MFYFQRPLVASNNYGGLTTPRAVYVTVTITALPAASPTATEPIP